MIEEFNKYVSNYDMNNENIKLKYNHSIRVMNLSEKYAKLLEFSDYDIKLAKLIGLLHDFGRFEQLKVYDSFCDHKTIDHADYSVEQLFNKGLIKNFWSNENDYELIKFAIKYHNKLDLPNINNERILMHARLIRDTDKLDIIYLLGYLGELDKKGISEKLTIEIYESIMNRMCIDYKYVKNANDEIACNFAYAFDINNNVCLEEFKNNLKYYYERVNEYNTFDEVYKEINNYINERIDKNVR
ncbi:MAG: HD domain-containing protein [Bacilli bacterium]|nr:HD domain-containing protein [Bacilli bacterium]